VSIVTLSEVAEVVEFKMLFVSARCRCSGVGQHSRVGQRNCSGRGRLGIDRVPLRSSSIVEPVFHRDGDVKESRRNVGEVVCVGPPGQSCHWRPASQRRGRGGELLSIVTESARDADWAQRRPQSGAPCRNSFRQRHRDRSVK